MKHIGVYRSSDTHDIKFIASWIISTSVRLERIFFYHRAKWKVYFPLYINIRRILTTKSTDNYIISLIIRGVIIFADLNREMCYAREQKYQCFSY